MEIVLSFDDPSSFCASVVLDVRDKVNVLLVEDDRIVREATLNILQDCPARVVTAHNGAEALLFFKQEKFDLVLLDIGLPDIDGFSVCRGIRRYERKLRKCRGVKVMAYSLTRFTIGELACAGLDGSLAKPADPEEIEALIYQCQLDKNLPAVE